MQRPADKIKAVVLDTSIFVNPDVRVALGANPSEALSNFIAIVAGIEGYEFYMPPSVFEELMNFVDKDKLNGDVFSSLTLKSPSKYDLTVPAMFIYEFVDDMRDRINKGLRFAERAVRLNGDAQKDDIIRDLRKKYREALREGVIDSKEDVDLILLAKELDAMLVTADKGALMWADKLGVKWIYPEKFKEFLHSINPGQISTTESPASS